MKTALYGRIVFGASAALNGVIDLMWHDADTWQSLPFPTMPLGAVIAPILAVAQILGALALFYPRAARQAAIVLGVVYAIFTLGNAPEIASAPLAFPSYINFFELLSVVCGAIALYTLTTSERSSWITIGRIGIGICSISFAVAQLYYFKYTASLVPKWIPGADFWTWLTTIAFALVALACLINIKASLALRLMAVMTAIFGLAIWVPALITHPQTHGNWSEFAVNYLITGAAWLVAAALERASVKNVR